MNLIKRFWPQWIMGKRRVTVGAKDDGIDIDRPQCFASVSRVIFEKKKEFYLIYTKEKHERM